MTLPEERISPFVMKRVRETYLTLSPDSTARDKPYVDLPNQDGGLGFHLTFRMSRRLNIYNLFGWSMFQHFRGGDWTFRLSFSQIEFWLYDDVEYVTGSFLPAGPGDVGFRSAPAFFCGFLTPDISFERNLDRAHHWKLIFGNDFLLSLMDLSDQENFYAGLLLSPRIGIQIPLWIAKIRVYGSYNYWWRFKIRNRTLGWTIGLDLAMGRDFGRF